MLWVLLGFFLMATPGLSSTVKIVKDASGKAPTLPEPCLMTCAGSTGAGVTEWKVIAHGVGYKLYANVDMSHCGFVDTPVVTTSLAGSGLHDLQKGVSAPWRINKDSFGLLIIDNGIEPTVSFAQQFKWHINWIAVGFNCKT